MARPAGSLVAVGRTSDVYEYGSDLVVKVPRPNVPTHWAAIEARLTTAVRQLGAPAPAVLGMVEIDGRDAIVFERVDGQPMWELIQENPGCVASWGRALAEVHQRILRFGLPACVAGLVERMGMDDDSTWWLTARRSAASVPEG